jgi:hypothetical protein
MPRGRPPFPQYTLTEPFRACIRRAMLARRPTGGVLALIAGFSHQSTLSNLLHATRLSATPLTLARMRTIAQYLGYTGPLFEEDREVTR